MGCLIPVTPNSSHGEEEGEVRADELEAKVQDQEEGETQSHSRKVTDRSLTLYFMYFLGIWVVVSVPAAGSCCRHSYTDVLPHYKPFRSLLGTSLYPYC